MSEPRTATRLERVLTWVCAALTVGFVGASLFGSGGVARHERLRDELKQVKDLNTSLREENGRLGLEASALRQEPAYIEAVIRDELGWVRPDELVFMFPRAAEADAPAEDPAP